MEDKPINFCFYSIVVCTYKNEDNLTVHNSHFTNYLGESGAREYYNSFNCQPANGFYHTVRLVKVHIKFVSGMLDTFKEIPPLANRYEKLAERRIVCENLSNKW